MRPAKSLRQTKKAKTRREIAAAAERLFLEKGYDSTTLDDIASEVEIHKLTILRYFKSKDEIALEDKKQVLDAFSVGLRDPNREISVISFWREHVHYFSDIYIHRPSALRRDVDLCEIPRLFGQVLALDLGYEKVLSEALCAEKGLSRNDDLKSRMLAASLVAGNRAVARDVIARGELAMLKERCLDVIDQAVRIFGYDEARPAVPGKVL